MKMDDRDYIDEENWLDYDGDKKDWEREKKDWRFRGRDGVGRNRSYGIWIKLKGIRNEINWDVVKDGNCGKRSDGWDWREIMNEMVIEGKKRG